MNREQHERIAIRCQVGFLDAETSDRFWQGERPQQWQSLIVDVVVRGSNAAYYLVDVDSGERAAEPLRSETLPGDELDALWANLAEIAENRRKTPSWLTDEEAEAGVKRVRGEA